MGGVRTSSRAGLAHASVGVVVSLAYMASGGGGVREVLFSAVGVWAAAGVAWTAAGQRPHTAAALRLVAAGLASSALGDAVLTSYEVRGVEAPFPSVGDVGYLAGYGLLSAGLVQLARRRTTRESLIDACIVTAGISGVVWLSVLAPLLEEGWSLGTVVAMSYPLGSVLLLVASMQLLLSWGRYTVGLRLLGLGLLAWLVADAVYAHQAVSDAYQPGTLVDGGWLAAYVLVAAGTMHPSLHTAPDAHEATVGLTPHRFLLLAVAAASTPAATALFRLEPVAPLMVLTVVGIVLSALRLSGPVEALRHHALRDPLTGLPNRTAVRDRAAGALLALHHERDAGMGVLFCDLDHFKVVNDSLGHPAGDELLCAIARRLERCARGFGTVGRLGGDEFVVVLDARDGVEAVAAVVAERVLAEVGRPVPLATGHVVSPSLSIGIRTTDDPGTDVDALLSDADAAMYDAKSRGRGAASRFDPAMREAAVRRLRLLSPDAVEAVEVAGTAAAPLSGARPAPPLPAPATP